MLFGSSYSSQVRSMSVCVCACMHITWCVYVCVCYIGKCVFNFLLDMQIHTSRLLLCDSTVHQLHDQCTCG